MGDRSEAFPPSGRMIALASPFLPRPSRVAAGAALAAACGKHPDPGGKAALEPVLDRFHPPALPGRGMVVPQEVQQAVDRKMRDLGVVRPPGRTRLLARPLDRDVDLAQETGVGGIAKLIGIRQGKGEDVGGAVGFQIVPVQPLERRVAREDEGNRRARTSEKREDLPDQRSKSGRS